MKCTEKDSLVGNTGPAHTSHDGTGAEYYSMKLKNKRRSS